MDKENKWIIEDIDETHCSACGYTYRSIRLMLVNDEKISADYRANCPKCGAEMSSVDIIGEKTFDSLIDLIKRNNGEYLI